MDSAKLAKWLRQRTSVLLTNPEFLRLWAGLSTSGLGDWVGYTALTLYMYKVTGSATALAILTIVRSLPVLLLGPFAGVVVDRFSRRRVMIVSDLARAFLYALLPFATSLPQIVTIAFLTSGISAFFRPAVTALIPDLVKKDQLMEANSLLFSTANLTMIVGPALGGLMVGFLGQGWAFRFDAVTFLVSALAIYFVIEKWQGRSIAQEAQGAKSWVKDLASGLGYIIRQRAVVVMTIEMMMMSLGMVAVTVLEVIFVKSILGAGDEGYGLLLSVAGVGALLGSLLAGWVGKKASASALFCWTGVLGGLTFFLYANIRYFFITLIIVLVQMLIFSIGQVASQALMQQLVPEELRGRVFSQIITGHTVTYVLGAGLWGVLIDRIGVIPVFNIAGGVATLAGLFILANLPVLQEAEERALGLTKGEGAVAIETA
jgi:DHA3 family macrolide efflux protein-like MFS transporter